MGEQQTLLELEQRPAEEPRELVPLKQLQLRGPNRRQFTYAAIDVEALIPAEKPGTVSVFLELARRHGDFAMAGLACHA